MRIVTIGATGLVGSLLVERLLGAGHEVDAVLRRPSGKAHEALREHVAAIGDWPEIVRSIAADAAVSTLGTTWAAAGSEAAFRAVDRDAVIAFAGAARHAGARRMLTVSSVGADAASRSFYLRTKGEADATGPASGVSRRRASGGRADRDRAEPAREPVPARAVGAVRGDRRARRRGRGGGLPPTRGAGRVRSRERRSGSSGGRNATFRGARLGGRRFEPPDRVP